MKLSKEDQKRYPKFAKYVRERIPLLVEDKTIVDTMHELVHIDKAKVKNALRWGELPTVKFVEDLVCDRGANGCFRNGNPNQVEIEARIVERYERDESDEPLSTGITAVERAAVVLLHELVHWADYHVDQKHETVDVAYHDVGEKWEWMTFGMILP